jgi:hypothetical protein
MGASWFIQADEPRLLAHVMGTEPQSTQRTILMAGLFTLLLMNLLNFREEEAHLEQKLQHWSILELWGD